MAVPKYRPSKSAKNMRRSHHALKPMGLSYCKSCGEVKLPHQVCSDCGTYKGKEVFKPKQNMNMTDADLGI